MELIQDIKVAVDAIVFSCTHNELKVLLIKQKFGSLKDQWALVGGFVKNNESLNDAVNRELHEETGIKVNYLEQLYTFGDRIDRDPRFRVITIAYFALVNSTQFTLKAGTDAQDVQWFAVNALPPLAFDHNEIIKKAKNRLQNKLTYQPIGFELLNEEFLFSELENIYCILLEKEIDRRNFRKKILSFGIVEQTGKFAKRTKGRPAKLFKFNKEKYTELTKEGFLFDI